MSVDQTISYVTVVIRHMFPSVGYNRTEFDINVNHFLSVVL